MDFSHQATYDATPAEVRAMLADPAFREEVCRACRATDQHVSITGAGEDVDTGSVMDVVVDQTRPTTGVPAAAKKFVGDELRIVQRESWRSAREASLTVEIPGKPGRVDGRITLAGTGSGTTEIVTGAVRVKVPMIGGRLESLIVEVLAAALRTEMRVGRDWLAGRR